MLGIRCCRQFPWPSLPSTFQRIAAQGKTRSRGGSIPNKIDSRLYHSDLPLLLTHEPCSRATVLRLSSGRASLLPQQRTHSCNQYSTSLATVPSATTAHTPTTISTLPTASSNTNTPLIQGPVRSPSEIVSSSSTGATTAKKTFRPWDPQLDATIISLYEQYKINWRTIGKVINRPHSTVYGRYLQNIQPALKRGWVPPQIEDQSRLEQLITQAKMLMEESRTQAAAALAQKRALSSAARLAKRVRPPWTEEVDRKIAELVESGSNWPQIGEALGRPYSSCYSRWYTVLEPSLKNVWTGEAIIRLNKLAKQGKGWTEIGQELKIRPLACRAKWSQLGKARSPLAISSSLTAIPLHTEGSDLGDSYSSTSEDESSEGTRSAKTKAIAFSETESALILQLAKEHGPDQWHIVLEEFRKQLLGSTLSTTSPSSPEAEHKDAKARARRLAAFDRRSMTITAASLEHQFIRLSRIKDIWTLDQETRLIQQVLRNGTSEEVWSEIAQNSGFHSAQECRTRWKQLDMPVRLNSTPWGKAEQSMFWYLWRHFGPNFNQISKSIVRRSAADCQHFFENATRSVPDPEQDPVLFSQKMQEIQDRLPIPRQKNSFTKERSLRLQLAMRQIGTEIGKRHSDGYYGSWDWVAYMVQPGISKTSCMEHWYYLRRNMDVVEGPLELGKNEVKTAESSSWSHEEAKLLDQGMREFASSWSQIQQRYLPWRTTRAIRQRWWIISDRSLLVDEEEYYKIISAGDAAEEIDFDALAKTMPGWKRSPCRRVFETSYKHLVRTTRWSPEEDQLLLRQVLAVRGRDWNAVASHFHGVQTARATLFGQTAETMTMSPYEIEGLRIQKSAWQCRLRWCQLVEPLMCKEPVLAATEKSHALKASKKLLEA